MVTQILQIKGNSNNKNNKDRNIKPCKDNNNKGKLKNKKVYIATIT